MPLNEDIQSFGDWANSIGFTLEDLPSNDALKSLFKCRQSALFFKIMERVQSRQKVTEIRQNIIVTKMENLKDQIIPATTRNLLPRAMQRFLKIQDLQKSQAEYDAKLIEAKAKCNSTTIKNKNMEKIKMINTSQTLETQLNILELKLESLTTEFQNELEYRDKIQSTMPVKTNSKNSDENLVTNAIMQSFQELNKFYTVCLTNSNPVNIKDAKDELWLKLRENFSNLPNSIIWNVIVRLKDEQLNNIKTLNNSFYDKNNLQLSNHNMTSINIEKMKVISFSILIISNYLSTKIEYKNLSKKFINDYQDFTNAIQSKIGLYSTEMQPTKLTFDEILSDYVVQYSTLCYNKGQMDYLIKEIECLKKRIDDGKHKKENNVILMTSLKQIYNDISITVQRIQQEIIQLGEIKDKIRYSKTFIQYMFNDIKQNTIKLSTSGGESFNISDNVLCSTKLDFDSTTASNMTIRSDCTILSTIGNCVAGGTNGGLNSILPQYSNELSAFMETPISKLHFMPKECFPYLLPNPILIESIENVSTIQFCPSILLTTDGSIKYVKGKCDWYLKIKNISKELRNDDVHLIEINEKYFKENFQQQHEEIIEMLDTIDVFGIKTIRTLKKAEKYYLFLLNNPLKNYIPNTKLFNNRTYADYDAEYSLYYRMANVGGSIRD